MILLRASDKFEDSRVFRQSQLKATPDPEETEPPHDELYDIMERNTET